MDLGCIDLGCISLCDDKQTAISSPNDDSNDSSTSASKTTKSKSPKGSPPSGRNALNRVESQIKKPRHRKTSPINWSPRRKGDSFLKRKIKSLQEAGGMNDTLEETLGHANPHYCRVLREKMAAKKAACRVIETRKAAMVEASWCRILKAARIPTKEAEALLLKAEKEAADAVEAAPSKGVIMYDAPDHPRKQMKIEKSSVSGNGCTTHTIKASFEVDKQVAAAVKAAFIRLAHYSSFNKDEFKDLLRRISENPDDTQELSESDTGSEVEPEGSGSERKGRKKLSPQKYSGAKLVNMMHQRLKRLNEEELASLATIVATCGLNAALADTETHNKTEHDAVRTKHDAARTKQVDPKLPSLDKFLVKKLMKLEKEVQEAKNAARKAEFSEGKNEDSVVLVKATTEDKKVSTDGVSRTSQKHNRNRQVKQEDIPSLDKFLVKHVTKLERAVQEAKNWQKDSSCRTNREKEKENVDSNAVDKEQFENGEANKGEKIPKLRTSETVQCESLDKYLVKHVSRLEKEKLEFAAKEAGQVTQKTKPQAAEATNVGGLDQILVKHKSRLEKEKTVASQQPPEGGNSYAMCRRQARERELLDTWGGIGLGGSMRPHVSRLQRDKAAWIKAEEEESSNARPATTAV